MELANDRTNEEKLHLFKKVGSNFKLRIEPYFLSHAERGESLQNQDFVGGMQNRRRFAPTGTG
jgi:hypothetical protein